ncbi:MAG TPA: TetR family transcriptional regulator [Ottowia sp.]|uniref:TetR family transcriptional regulator n=1 Tax=Ottowia sp. TaxID=1898956 RepID=UPI002B72C237|nr:TetR family transcriptional regulator [Ottowia sp.]HMN22671.1 TetR family transcriptional regulator [Ottowia sp.]
MARRTKEEAQATREALLDAAERVFQQRGVSRTALSDIAQAAGVTRGALYWHFKDKAAVFNAMMDRVALPLGAELEGLLATGGDPLARLCEHLRRALRQIVHDAQTRRVLRVAMQKVEHTDELGPVIDRHIQMHRLNTERERQVFERATALRGRPLPAPADQLAHGFYAMVHGLIYSWLLDESFDLEATAAVSVRAFLRGVGLEPDPAATASP